MLSVNQKAMVLTEDLCKNAEDYGVEIKKNSKGTTIVDAGIHAKGGFEAGRIVTEICMGGLGKARILPKPYGDTELTSIFVQTDHPAIATLGSQFAGWQIKEGDFFAIGSGPARALALKPHNIYDEIGYKDEFDSGIVVLETSKEPSEDLLTNLAHECTISPSQLYVILVPTTSIAGSTQVSGRIVETGLHKMTKLGINPLSIQHSWGYAPIAPVHPEFMKAMGKTNDVILYGGVAYYALEHEDDDELSEILKKAPSSASKHYGRPFSEIFKEANYDFYKIDPNLFAPAMLIVNNLVTGYIFEVGKPNIKILKEALDLSML